MTVYGSHGYPEKSVAKRVAIGAAVAVFVLVLLVVLATCAGPNAGQGAADPSASPSAGSGTGQSSAQPGDGNGGNGDGGNGDGGNGGGNGNGNGGGNGDGGGDGDGGDGDGGDDPVAPAGEDCVGYNPSNLTVESIGDAGWVIKDGGHSLALFDTEADAKDGVKVARNFTKSCFIGRNNTRGERYRYITRYWKSPSGLPFGPAPTLDCVSYNPHNLTVEAYGEAGWRLIDGGHAMLLLDTQADAERAKLVAAEHTQLCFIGRNNTRPDRHRYIVEHWRG